MDNNEKMFFIENIEYLNNEKLESIIYEYEIIANAHIVGECTYGPYCFGAWEFSDKQEGEERKLYLKVKRPRYEANNEEWKFATENGFYHGGDIADELVILSSLFFRRKLKLGPMVRMDDKPTMHTYSKAFIDKALIRGKSNLAELSKWLKLVEGLDIKYHQKFILAVRLYHRALLFIEEEPDMAYLDLVSSIEVLSNKHTNAEIEKLTVSDICYKLAENVDSIKEKIVRDKIKQAILKRERFIRRRFIEFICDYVEESFWKREGRPNGKYGYGIVNPGQLPEVLNRIYNQRSKTLHNGEPFPPYIFTLSKNEDETDSCFPSRSIDEKSSRILSIGRKAWYEKDCIPKPHFFESLVNHVLKTFLKKNQKTTK